MPKHSSKTLMAHQQLLWAMQFQVEALMASHPPMRPTLSTILTLLRTLPELEATAPPTLSPTELPPVESYEDQD